FEEPETPDVEIPSDYERPIPAEDMNVAYADFSVELFKRSLTDGENSLISPASVEFALVMALNGADGDTLTEMLTVLCPGATTEEINAFVSDLNSMLTYSSGSEFYVANSVWSNETILGDCLNETYANTLKEDMNAEAYMLPFNNKAVDKINDWVDENTDGMITELLKEIPPDAAMYLINAMTFEGEWSEAYEEYQIREGEVFTNALGEEEEARMLCETGNLYLENDDATGFIKYYEGGEYAFMAMLPKEEGAIEDYVANMTGEDYIAFYESLTTQYDVVTKLPCFTYSYDLTLNDALIEMGMPTAFTEGAADFSPMVTDPTVNLYISNVIHKTYIELDENGTKAAAVTAVEMDRESCAEPEQREIKEVILDRPFVYAIIDTNTGLPIFMGTVNSVAE
ncbi:MAG: serpin family protein, partial [Lachnospiraceae bacterium]|nr:serpin family protein [Lachnospiraceae bacterium]